MAKKAPGKHFRKGVSLRELTKMFPDNAAAERWFISIRWPDGPVCPYCGSYNVQSGIKHKTMTHRCRDCSDRKMFSLKTGTVLAGSKLGYQHWAFGLYLVATGIKGTSSMKLHRDLGVTQKTAWHMAHRIRRCFEMDSAPFEGPVEADETFVGGKEKNKHAKQRRHAGRGPVGKTAVVGVKGRTTKRIRAAVVSNTDSDTLKGFVSESTKPDAMVYTDGEAGYVGLPRHEVVRHSVGEYVRGMAHTNGIESFWSMLKRGYYGTYHKMSPKHLDRYVNEFAGRHNHRNADTMDQMGSMVRGLELKRLRYKDLVA